MKILRWVQPVFLFFFLLYLLSETSNKQLMKEMLKVELVVLRFNNNLLCGAFSRTLNIKEAEATNMIHLDNNSKTSLMHINYLLTIEILFCTSSFKCPGCHQQGSVWQEAYFNFQDTRILCFETRMRNSRGNSWEPEFPSVSAAGLACKLSFQAEY